MVDQGVMVEIGCGEMAMASNCTLPPEAASPRYSLYPPPLATYEDVVASPERFRETLKKLHTAMGSKFMIPTVGGQELDLHQLFVEVTSRGGLAKAVHDKKWKEVIGVFNFPSSATNASFILRKYYSLLLLHYEQIYFFKAVGWDPETINAMQGSSRAAASSRGSTEPLLPSPSAPANEAHAFDVNTQAMPEACSAIAGSSVHGVIDGKFDNGYLITVKIGSEEFKGVLYQTVTEPVHQEEQHPSSQQPQVLSVDNRNSASASGSGSGSRIVRRKRRKKSEIRKRDPAHPKPNRSGYNFFFAEQHARLKPLYPGKDRDISKMIGELWSKLNEPEKSIYQEKAAKDKERYRMEMELYRERLKPAQMGSNALLIQQLPSAPPVSVMDKEKKPKNEDAKAPSDPENMASSSMVGNSNLGPSSECIISNAVPVQSQSVQPEINLMDLDKNPPADADENYLSITENETSSSNKSDRSNMDESMSQIFNDAIPAQQQPDDTNLNTIDLEKELQTDGANSATMPENQTISTETCTINLNSSLRMILSDTIPMQQQPHEAHADVHDQNQKLQKVPENETSPGKEISDDELAFGLQKGMERDEKREQEFVGRISSSIEGNILPASEERAAVATTAEDVMLSNV